MRRSLLSRRVWPAVIAIVCGVLFQSVFHQGTNWQATSALCALVAVSALNPFAGILLLAGLGPLSTILGSLLGAPGPLHFAEAMTLAFLTGAAARRAWRGDAAPDPRLDAVAALLLAAALASAAVHAVQWLAEQPELTLSLMLNDFLVRSDPLTAAMQFAEGPLLVIVVAGACAAEGVTARVARMMVLGAGGAAMINVARLLTVWLRTPDTSLVELFLNVRVNAQYGDLNAAGSYFAMTTVFALGAIERARRWALPAAIVIVVALWLAGSRTALACAALVFVAREARRMRGRTLRQNGSVLASLLLLSTLGLAAWMVYPHYRNDRPLRAIRTRLAFAAAGLQMAKEHPVFGVGLGAFHDLSVRYLPPMPGVTGGDNAHNQFVQVLAELGATGLALTIVLLALPLTAAARTGWQRHAEWTLAAAPLTYLLTALAGHPWLVPEAAYPFWIALGLAATALPSASDGTAPAGRGRGAFIFAIMIALIILPLPMRIIDAHRNADMSNTTSGLSRWQHEPDQTRWRWAGGHATFYVDASARMMRLPFRLPPGAAPVDVRISLDGLEADHVRVRPGEAWQVVPVVLVRRAGTFARVDIDVAEPGGTPVATTATDAGGAVMIGQPIINY